MGLLAVTVAGTPIGLRAQATNAPLPGLIQINKNLFPFHGKLSAIDNKASTITLNNQTIQITTDTKISRQGKPAALADGAEGDMVAGTFRKEADGKLKALDLNFAPKHPTQSSASKTNQTNKATP
jgi:hypothetical protein